MSNLRSDYAKLMEKAKAISILRSASDIVRWDMETYMPPRGVALRSEELALLSGVEHKMVTDPEVGVLLGKIEEDFMTLDEAQRRNVYLVRKTYNEQVKLPQRLVSEIAKQEAVATDAWKKSKAAKDFSMFKLDLEKLVDLKKEAAGILKDVKGTETPYDALIDIYEPKMMSRMIDGTFSELRRGLTSIAEKCQASPKQPDIRLLQRRVPIETQQRISRFLVKFLKYDVESKEAGGRIDETEHPFTTGYYSDVRITTHYHEERFTSSLFSVLHEGGHAIYEQDLNAKWMYQPIGAGCSLGIHESQSRFVENVIGRSREFWRHFLPKLKEATGSIFSDVALDDLVFAVNRVQPSKIRTEADEVTYCLHIIIRFEIERDLIANKISVAELPQVWNQKYKDYLDVNVEDDSEGVLQDTHWASGSIGYFPTYALGNIYSGQILSKMSRNMPDWKDRIAKGNFQSVKQWLRRNVHQYGNLYDPKDLIKRITGEEVNSTHYLNYLKEKYSQLYGF